MSVNSIARTLQIEAGWTDSTLLELCLEFIENNNMEDSFSSYLEQQINDENLLEEI